MPNPDRNTGLVADCAALLTAKSALEGTSANLNWSADRAISGWDGVTIASNRVSKLKLAKVPGFAHYGYGLMGAIPAELGNLSNLDELDLSTRESRNRGNHLQGAIPAELGNLAQLKTLNLSGNKLSGAIPSELGNLANLKTLDLSGNYHRYGASRRDVKISGIEGAIPAELGNLAKLETLRLGANRLTGAIPAELGNLASLTTLDLAVDVTYPNPYRLSGEIPSELGNLAKLTTLDLSGNWLTGEIPSELGNLANLEFLSIHGTHGLTGDIPSELGNLAKLRTLHLHSNDLTGKIPAELGNLAKLTHLYLSRNRLTGDIPAELGNLAKLTDLVLNENRLTGDIPSELGNLSNLRRLRLGRNLLTGCVPRSLRERLWHDDIDIVGMRFCAATTSTSTPMPTSTPTPTATSVSGATATPTPTAVPLTEQCSNGTAVPNPDRNTGLVSDCAALLASKSTLEGATSSPLDWSADRAVSDWYGVTTTNNRVTSVVMYGDDEDVSLVGEIPAQLGNLAKLEGLTLSFFGLTGEIPAELGNLANLTSLDISDNILTGAVPSELGNLANLTSLDLSYNDLTGCVPQSLRAAAASAHARMQNSLSPLPFCAAATPVTPTPTATSAPRPPRPTITPTPTTAPRETPVATPTPTATPAIVIETTPTPTATPEPRETPVATPTPTATPVLVIETTPTSTPTPSPTATPTSVVSATDDPCVESLSGSGSATGAWAAGCLTANPPNAFDYYARFYTFTLDAASEVAITLSSDATAPYLYLLDGAGKTGAIKRETGAANASAATITETLQPGSYTIEATTFYAATAGAFTLEFAATPAPAATCAEPLAGNASVNGAWATGCLSANPPNDRAYYARFYTFTLSAASEVSITLSSNDAAPYLYLLNGAGTTGAIKRETGAANASAATITETLQPGAYTIEATTYYSETAGDFTLELELTQP